MAIVTPIGAEPTALERTLHPLLGACEPARAGTQGPQGSQCFLSLSALSRNLGSVRPRGSRREDRAEGAVNIGNFGFCFSRTLRTRITNRDVWVLGLGGSCMPRMRKTVKLRSSPKIRTVPFGRPSTRKEDA